MLQHTPLDWCYNKTKSLQPLCSLTAASDVVNSHGKEPEIVSTCENCSGLLSVSNVSLIKFENTGIDFLSFTWEGYYIFFCLPSRGI